MKKETMNTKELFKKTRPLTKKQRTDIEKKMFSTGYLYKESNTKTAYCTCCNKRFKQSTNNFEIKRAKHNEMLKCPLCKSKVKIKDAGRSRSNLVDYQHIAIFTNLKNKDNTLLLRSYYLKKDFTGQYENVQVKYYEQYRIYYCPGKKTQAYRQHTSYYDILSTDHGITLNFLQMAQLPRCVSMAQNVSSFKYRNKKMLSDAKNDSVYFGMKEIKKNLNFKYFSFPKNFFSEIFPAMYYIPDTIDMFCKHPVLYEKLLKEGFSDTVIQIIRSGNYEGLNVQAKTVKGFFKNVNSKELEIIRDNQELFKHVAPLKKYNIDISKQTASWASDNYFFNYKRNCVCYGIENPETTIKYLIKKKYRLADYRDYIRLLKKYNVEYTKKNRYPRYPEKAHDNMVLYDKQKELEKRIKENVKKVENFQKNIYPILKKIFIYQDENFSVRPFSDISEIIDEGAIQNICVGGSWYTDRYLTGETYLFCLRQLQNQSKPFCTIEVSPSGMLIQSRMKHNQVPPVDVKAFIEKWKINYQKQLKKYKLKKKEVA